MNDDEKILKDLLDEYVVTANKLKIDIKAIIAKKIKRLEDKRRKIKRSQLSEEERIKLDLMDSLFSI